jgi:GNAT superfamily N-acetyltransferase
VDDVDELVRLREVLFDAMGSGGAIAEWSPVVAEQLRTGLADGRFFAAVVDAPSGDGLAGAGGGMVHEVLAGGPSGGRVGHVQSMATDPRWRRHGVGRAVFERLMTGFADRGVVDVALLASADGEALYRSFGFCEPHHRYLRWRAEGPV